MHKRTVLIGLVAGMLLVSVIPVSMLATAYAQTSININGAGATFPFPLIDTWRVEYSKLNPQVNVNYQSIGSGGGIKQFTGKTVDFGATDAPLTETQRGALSAPAVHIPETIGAVVPVYNVVGLPATGLKLSGPILADIYLKKIWKWDDPAIKALNPSLALPSKDIVVVRRSDGSGTTFVWTDYLSKVSPEWAEKVGKGTAVPWPTGRGAPGNAGVANMVKGVPTSIGYVELAYALTTGMQIAAVQNSAGNFIQPTLASTKAAVEASAGSLPKGEDSWTNVTLTNAAGPDSYPIASLTYLLLYKEMSNSPTIDSMDKAKAIVNFVSWAVTDGQKYSSPLSYVPLPDEVVKLDKDTLMSLTFKGEPVMSSIPTPTQTPTPTPMPQQSTITAALDGKNYIVTAKSSAAKVTEVNINSNKSVGVKFDNAGEVELTLPTNMISGISMVKAGSNTVSFENVGSSADSKTIKFTVPPGYNSVEIMGATVVPEFGVIAAIVLGLSLVGVIGFSRLKGIPGGL